jgi:hypothetical protein
MTTSALHSAGYFPQPTIGSRAPVYISIELDVDDVDRSEPIPQWSYAIEVKLADGRNWTWGGFLEAMDAQQAQLRAYSRAIDRLGELLADYVSKENKR